jgi:hypothetical protein
VFQLLKFGLQTPTHNKTNWSVFKVQSQVSIFLVFLCLSFFLAQREFGVYNSCIVLTIFFYFQVSFEDTCVYKYIWHVCFEVQFVLSMRDCQQQPKTHRCTQDILYVLVTLFSTWKWEKIIFWTSSLPLAFQNNFYFIFFMGISTFL